jgi:hypothetical protein
MTIDLPFVLPFNVPTIKLPDFTTYPDYSFYGVPFGIYAMMGVTTVILATMTIYDSNNSSSTSSESITSQLPNLMPNFSSQPEEVEEVPVEEPQPPIEQEPQEEPKIFGGKKKTDKRKGGKGKTKQKKEKQKKNKTRKR